MVLVEPEDRESAIEEVSLSDRGEVWEDASRCMCVLNMDLYLFTDVREDMHVHIHMHTHTHHFMHEHTYTHTNTQ